MHYIDNYDVNIGTIAENRRIELETQLQSKKKVIYSKNVALEKVYSSYEREIYNEKEFVTRRDRLMCEIRSFEDEIEIIQLALNNLNNEVNPEKINLLKMFKEVVQNEGLTHEDLNALYGSNIKAIYFIRDTDDNVNLKIDYK